MDITKSRVLHRRQECCTDEIVAFEIHVGTLKGGGKPLRVGDATKCGMFILHVRNMHRKRDSRAADPLIKNDWRWMLGLI